MATPNWVEGCGVSTAGKNQFLITTGDRVSRRSSGQGVFSLSLKSESVSSLVFIAVLYIFVSVLEEGWSRKR